jgi:uncharacterized membrane protein YtjA (UPF0391 family)
MNIPKKFLSRYEAVAIKQNIYTFGAITAAVLAFMGVVKVMAWVTKSLLAVLAIFVVMSYITMRRRREHPFTNAARPA